MVSAVRTTRRRWSGVGRLRLRRAVLLPCGELVVPVLFRSDGGSAECGYTSSALASVSSHARPLLRFDHGRASHRPSAAPNPGPSWAQRAQCFRGSSRRPDARATLLRPPTAAAARAVAHQLARTLGHRVAEAMQGSPGLVPGVVASLTVLSGVFGCHATAHRDQLLASYLLLAVAVAVIVTFAAGLSRIVRRTEGEDGWLAMAALASVVGTPGSSVPARRCSWSSRTARPLIPL